MVKQITVLGAGYVGLTTAALFAVCGYKVFLIEPDKKRSDVIKKGRAFFYELGMDELLSKVIKDKSLVVTDYKNAVPKSEFIFSCVGTPDNPDGSSNLSYIFRAAKQTSKLIKPGATFIQKSTVPVGTGSKLEDLFKQAGANISYISNPEFLREGTAISDTLWFDRIVVGGQNISAINAVIDLYRGLEKCRSKIANIAHIKSPEKIPKGEYIKTGLASAELIKVTSNAFLALKISFANNIAKLADEANADITEVMDAVGSDTRIVRAFLNAGRGYGGGCFPKDVSGLINSATDYGVDLPIMTAASEVNSTMPGYIANKILTALGGSFDGKKIAVLGLAFKAGTSDARRSPGVKLANILSHDGAQVRVYDPKANGEAREDLRKSVEICGSASEAVKSCHAVVIATDWPEFLKINMSGLKKSMRGNLFVDAMNAFDIVAVEKTGLQYVGVGRNGTSLVPTK